MNIDKVREDVVKLVEEILEQKAVAGIQADVEDALNEAKKAVIDMTEKVAELESKVSGDAAAIEALEASKTELEAELATKSEVVETLTAEKEDILKRAEEAEASLDTLVKDTLMKERMSELEGLSVARSGASRDKQSSLVREMSDEEFAAYKEDMIALREEIVASLNTFEEKVVEEVKEEPLEEKANEGAGEEKEEIQTPPADINKGLETASATLPNVESASTENAWSGFGTGLAEYIRKNRGEASKQ